MNRLALRTRSRADGTKDTWRDVVQLAVSKNGALLHHVELAGIDDIERGATELLRLLR